jgi:hypothetical protein
VTCALGGKSLTIAAVRRVCREQDGRVPSVRLIDALLDERSELTGS